MFNKLKGMYEWYKKLREEHNVVCDNIESEIYNLANRENIVHIEETNQLFKYDEETGRYIEIINLNQMQFDSRKLKEATSLFSKLFLIMFFAFIFNCIFISNDIQANLIVSIVIGGISTLPIFYTLRD